MRKHDGRPAFAQLVRDSLAAGMAKREAEAHARKIREAYDVIVVDAQGRGRFVTNGSLITDAVKTPSRKRAKGKTQTTKGQ